MFNNEMFFFIHFMDNGTEKKNVDEGVGLTDVLLIHFF